MKPWEIKRTKDKIRRMSGAATVRIFFDLYKAGIKILRASLLEENPRLTPQQVKAKINKLADSIGKI